MPDSVILMTAVRPARPPPTTMIRGVAAISTFFSNLKLLSNEAATNEHDCADYCESARDYKILKQWAVPILLAILPDNFP